MTNYPESGVKLVIETSDAQSAVDELMSQLDSLQSGDYSVSVSAEVDTSGVEDALSDLPLDGENVDFTVNVEQTGDDLSDLPPDGDTIETAVNVEETDTAKETLKNVKLLTTMKVIETVWNIAGNAVDIVTKFGAIAVKPMLELGNAVAEVGAKTGDAIPNADKLINGIFYDDLGKSKEEVGKLIIAAHGLGLPVEEATRAALTFTHTWSDTDSTTAITAFGTLLNTNLVDNMQEASDLMATFFQAGGNKGGDALQVVNANAESWSNMGLSAQEALSTISTLLKGNVDNATDAAKMIQTLDDNLTTAAANADSPQAKMLKTMGMINPKDSGKAMGADFIDGFASAFTTLSPDQQDLASGLFMGKGGKKFTGAIEGMTAQSDIFKNVTDAAAIAATEIDNSLSGAIDDFVLMANKKMEEFLSSDAIDLDGKIAALKDGLQKGMAVLAEGGSLSEGLSVALKPLGFDDEFQGLESALGNLVIGILQAVAMLQENPLIGNNAEAAAGTRATLAGMANTQLAFDLKIANPDQIAVDISTAVSRGVAPQTIAETVGGVVDELIKNGALKQAQTLVDTLSKPIDQNTLPLLANGTPMNVEPVVTDEAIKGLQNQINTAYANAGTSFVVQAQNDVMGATNTVTPAVTVLKDEATATVKPVTDTATATKKLGDNAGGANKAVAGVSNTLGGAIPVADEATRSLGAMEGAIDNIIGRVDAFNTAAGNATPTATTNNATADPGKQFASGTGGFTGTAEVGENGRELVTSNRSLAVLNNMTTEAIMAAIQGYIPGHSVSSGSGGSFTAVNNNLVQSQAQADALGYSTAAQLRGMANK